MSKILIGLIILTVIIIIYSFVQYLKNKNKIFYSTDDYANMKVVEDNWKTIRDETPNFDIDTVTVKRGRTAWNNDEAIKLFNQLRENDNWVESWDPKGENNELRSGNWYNFPLIYKNNVIGKAGEICPKTIQILKSMGNINVAGYSLLLPNSELDWHTDLTGPTYNSMSFNMKLSGGKSDLKIKDKKNEIHRFVHTDGKAVIFNSELFHKAENYDDDFRIILYVDFATI